MHEGRLQRIVSPASFRQMSARQAVLPVRGCGLRRQVFAELFPVRDAGFGRGAGFPFGVGPGLGDGAGFPFRVGPGLGDDAGRLLGLGPGFRSRPLVYRPSRDRIQHVKGRRAVPVERHPQQQAAAAHRAVRAILRRIFLVLAVYQTLSDYRPAVQIAPGRVKSPVLLYLQPLVQLPLPAHIAVRRTRRCHFHRKVRRLARFPRSSNSAGSPGCPGCPRQRR